MTEQTFVSQLAQGLAPEAQEVMTQERWNARVGTRVSLVRELLAPGTKFKGQQCPH